MSEETIRSLIKEIALNESGDRGFVYEDTLINALETSGINVTPAAGNNNTISDLGFEVNGIQVGSEVKLGHKDNLGAIRKSNFESLTWDGSTFSGSPSADSTMPDVIEALITSMNSSAKVKERFKELEKHIVQFKPLPWDLMKSFGNDRGSENDAGLYSVLRNDPKRFPVPAGATPVSRKQIATPGDGVANIDQSTLLAIMSGKSAPNGADTSYVIVGYGPGSEKKVAGQIYSLGSDPLNLGAPIYTPGSIGVDIRFAGAGSSKSSRRFSFNFKTKATSEANSGIPFSSAEELASILTGGQQMSESFLRELIREALVTEDRGLLNEELTGSDKADIKRMIKKELEGPANRREIDKAFKKKFDAELKKALGSSFFGTPGKINKFVADEIQKAVEEHMGSTANREVVVRICKDVMVKLYRELSFSYKPLIDRMKV